MTLTTVVLDVGETLVDETTSWQAWADWLDVPRLTFLGVMGGLIARGADHREVFPLLAGRSFEQVRADRNADGGAWPAPELYPDAVPGLEQLRADGWRLVVGGNQPAAFQRLVEQLDLPVDLVTSSGELGVAKPDPAFYLAVAARAGVDPSECVHVGDRIDNDVVGALPSGMQVVHVRRGPWGVLHADEAARLGIAQVSGLADLPAALRDLRLAT